MRGEAASGPDGLSSTFYIECWDILGNNLAALIRKSWHSYYLSANIRMAAIVPIPKSLALDEVGDWRPISLLNIVCKLISKILACRLAILVGMVVAKQQGGFIKGRGAFSNILQAQLALAWAARSKFRGLAIKIDSHKAYDRVSHEFLFKLLCKLGFGDKLGKLIAMLYRDTPSFILINGHPAPTFTLGRGVRQGCPLAPLLYALTTQPLMALLLAHQAAGILKGWPVTETDAPFFLLFANDLIVFIPESQVFWNNLLEAIQVFCKASGNRINWTKCQVKHLLCNNAPDWILHQPCTWLEDRQLLTYMVAPLGPGVTAKDFIAIWARRANQMLRGWETERMSMAGRAVLVRHCLAAVPEYLASCGFPPFSNVDSFTTVIRAFLWGRNLAGKPRKAQIAWDKLLMAKKFGGLGFRRIQTQAIKHNSKWIHSLKNLHSQVWHSSFCDVSGFPGKAGLGPCHELSALEWLFMKPEAVRRANVTSPSLLAFWHHFRKTFTLSQLPDCLPARWPWWAVALLGPGRNCVSVHQILANFGKLAN
ncbi:unnamed protein product [Calypogeia fissa]